MDKIIVTADLFDSSIKSLAESDTLFLDIESNGFLFNRNTLCGVGISTATSEAMYFPFRHADHPEPLDNLSADHLATLLSTINKAKVLVGYNIKFDLKFLEFENPNLLTMEDKVLIDVLVMVRLTEKAKHERLDLTHTIAREFGEGAAEYDKTCKELLRKNKWNKNFSLAPISLLGFYCCDDVLWTRKLFFSRKSQIEATQQTQIWEQSIKLTSVLYQMEYRGVKIDSEYASDGAKRITARQEAVLKRIYDIAGQEFNV